MCIYLATVQISMNERNALFEWMKYRNRAYLCVLLRFVCFTLCLSRNVDTTVCVCVYVCDMMFDLYKSMYFDVDWVFWIVRGRIESRLHWKRPICQCLMAVDRRDRMKKKKLHEMCEKKTMTTKISTRQQLHTIFSPTLSKPVIKRKKKRSQVYFLISSITFLSPLSSFWC